MENKAIAKITSQEFIERIVLSKQDALVKVTNAWSGAGQFFSQVIRDLALKHTRVYFYSVECDPVSTVASINRVEAVPTLLFFKKGTLVDKLSGLTQRSIISDRINQLANQ